MPVISTGYRFHHIILASLCLSPFVLFFLLFFLSACVCLRLCLVCVCFILASTCLSPFVFVLFNVLLFFTATESVFRVYACLFIFLHPLYLHGHLIYVRCAVRLSPGLAGKKDDDIFSFIFLPRVAKSQEEHGKSTCH